MEGQLIPPSFRAIAWNCRRATFRSNLWSYLIDLAPDIALLQEVSSMPTSITDRFEFRSVAAMGKKGASQRFSTVVLVRGSIISDISLVSPLGWVTRELRHFAGNLVAVAANLTSGEEVNLVSVYSPAWPVSKARLIGEDVSAIKLTQNPDVWVADLLWASLKSDETIGSSSWLIAGDFNSCETFDAWKGGPGGNAEFLDRMGRLGLTECLRHAQGRLTPTFRKPGAEAPTCQIDHMFASQNLARRLSQCVAPSYMTPDEMAMSDHLPIVANFDSIAAAV